MKHRQLSMWDRVVVRSPHVDAGETGTVVGSPDARVLDVLLDSGGRVRVHRDHTRPDTIRLGGAA